MSRSALKEITSIVFMTHVWDDMLSKTPKKKRNGSGIDGVSLSDFESSRKRNLSDLSQDILKNRYQPSPLEPHFIPKTNKEERVICVPTVRDRLVQRCILHYLNNMGYTLNNIISYGFIKGQESAVKSAGARAITYRNESPWAYKADISAFFDTIERDQLKKIVSKKVKARSLRKLINLAIDTEIYAPSKDIRKKIKSKGISTGIGLRQGMPISPYLANLYLFDFDKKVIRKKIPMVRYADDLIAFGKSEVDCRKIHDFCVNALSEIGLKIHDINAGLKTEIAHPKDTVEFLGLGLSQKSGGKYELVVTKRQLDSIKQSLLELSKLEYCKKNNITISSLLQRLNSKIAGYDNAYDSCANEKQLTDSLRDYRTLVMKRLLTDNFEIDIGSLTKKKKWFLELGDL